MKSILFSLQSYLALVTIISHLNMQERKENTISSLLAPKHQIITLVLYSKRWRLQIFGFGDFEQWRRCEMRDSNFNPKFGTDQKNKFQYVRKIVKTLYLCFECNFQNSHRIWWIKPLKKVDKTISIKCVSIGFKINLWHILPKNGVESNIFSHNLKLNQEILFQIQIQSGIWTKSNMSLGCKTNSFKCVALILMRVRRTARANAFWIDLKTFMSCPLKI